MTPNRPAFTLIELLVVLIVVSLIVAVGIPTYRSFAQNSKSEVIANLIQSSLELARTEALARNHPVYLCNINSSQNSCDNTTTWTNGWAVFEDIDSSGTFNAGDVLLKFFYPYASGQNEVVVKNSGGTAVGLIGFTGYGFATTASQNATITITPTGCSGNNSRVLTLNNSGYITLATGACP